MRRFIFVSGFALAFAAAQATPFIEWDFNSYPDDNLSSTGSFTPDIGAGTISVIGGVVQNGFTWGGGTSASSDPFSNTNDNSAYQTVTFPAQGSSSGSAGIMVLGATTGYKNISIEFDQRNSNTASRYQEVDYTLDGGSSWFLAASLDQNVGGSIWMNNKSVTFGSYADNKANFGFRVVSVFAPSTTAYAATQSGSSYSSAGTWRFDMVQFFGTQVPEPASLLAIGVGLAGLLGLRRRK